MPKTGGTSGVVLGRTQSAIKTHGCIPNLGQGTSPDQNRRSVLSINWRYNRRLGPYGVIHRALVFVTP